MVLVLNATLLRRCTLVSLVWDVLASINNKGL